MRRMRQMLGDQVVVNIDDSRFVPISAVAADDTQYLPKKMTRMMRALRTIRLTNQTSQRLRNDWMLQTISRSNASLILPESGVHGQ